MRRTGSLRLPADTGGFRERGSSTSGEWLDIDWGVDAAVDARRVTGTLSSELLPVAADLVEVAAAVHTVDRLTPRTPPSLDPYGLSWRRTLRVRVGVRRRPVWSRRVVRECLAELLAWLSGDAAGDYRLDVCAGQPSHLPELDAMVWQVIRLREALADPRPWPRLVRAFPELLDAPAAMLGDGRAQLIRLYRAYCAEWSAIQSILAPTVVPRPEPGRA